MIVSCTPYIFIIIPKTIQHDNYLHSTYIVLRTTNILEIILSIGEDVDMLYASTSLFYNKELEDLQTLVSAGNSENQFPKDTERHLHIQRSG